MSYTDNTLMPFGMHKGKKLANVPASYFLYLYNETGQTKTLSNKLLAAYILDNIEAFKMEAVAEKQRRKAQRYFEKK